MDRFTRTEADAGRYEAAHAPEYDDDRPSRSDLAWENDPRAADGLPDVWCAADRSCRTRFHGLDTEAYRIHVAEEHGGPCVVCGGKAAGKSPKNGARVCWFCTPLPIVTLLPLHATSPDHRAKITRPGRPLPVDTTDLRAAFTAAVEKARTIHTKESL